VSTHLRTAPAVAGDVVFVGGMETDITLGSDLTSRFHVYAHAVDTGEQRWELPLDVEFLAEPPLVAAGRTAVLGSSDPGLTAVRAV
jgi:outer membrane protein assembly factor BamB